jgi:hypothetical protein
MQEVLHSPFDIETHKQTFVSYLEVVISPEGVVEYATPSHTDKLIEILAKQKGIKDFDEAKRYVFDTAINNGYASPIYFLTGVTGYISVWFDHYSSSDPPTKQQLAKLQELFKEGVYIGPVWDIVTPEREALKQFMESLKKLAKDRSDV